MGLDLPPCCCRLQDLVRRPARIGRMSGEAERCNPTAPVVSPCRAGLRPSAGIFPRLQLICTFLRQLRICTKIDQRPGWPARIGVARVTACSETPYRPLAGSAPRSATHWHVDCLIDYCSASRVPAASFGGVWSERCSRTPTGATGTRRAKIPGDRLHEGLPVHAIVRISSTRQTFVRAPRPGPGRACLRDKQRMGMSPCSLVSLKPLRSRAF